MVTIKDRMGAWRWERQVPARVSRAAWRLEQAAQELACALASARAGRVSIRTLAAAAGLSPAGCTRSWPPRTWTRWTPHWAGRGPRAGLPPEDPAGMTTPSWTGAT